MRIRSIKPSFFLHELLFDLEKETGLPVRVAFAGLWCAADREGRFKWEPRSLKAQILPFDECDFSRVLDALTTRGFLVKYASNGTHYGWIKTFKEHQIVNPREKASVLPSPAQSLDTEHIDACLTRGGRVNDACPTPLPVPVPVPVPERKSAEKENQPTAIDELRTRLSLMFKRKPSAPWGYDEQSYLCEVAKRPDCIEEMTQLEGFFQTGTYRPEKMGNLLSDWTGNLDRARNHNENSKRNRPKTFDRNAGTFHEGKSHLYSRENREKPKSVPQANSVPNRNAGT